MQHDLSRLPTEDELDDILNSPLYAPWTLKEYEFWSLRLNKEKQELPGRSVAWLKRHCDRMTLSDLTEAELHELTYTIIPEFTQAMRAWTPLLVVNVEWLGNEVHRHRGHGHMHLTPRFSEAFTVSGREFIDLSPNTRKSNPKLTLPEDELRVVFEKMRILLGG